MRQTLIDVQFLQKAVRLGGSKSCLIQGSGSEFSLDLSRAQSKLNKLCAFALSSKNIQKVCVFVLSSQHLETINLFLLASSKNMQKVLFNLNSNRL